MGSLIFISSIWLLMAMALGFWARRPVTPAAHRMAMLGFPPAPSDRTFLARLALAAFSVRAVVVMIFNGTDAIRSLHLSPDSLKYHRLGQLLAVDYRRGDVDWSAWIDHGWFQFTGLVYSLFGANPVIIQVINITVSTLTVIVVYHMVREAYGDPQIARWAAIMIALLPSFVYWSCLMLKDPASIFAVALMVWALVKLRSRMEFGPMAGLIIGLMIVLALREYLFLVSLFLIGISLLPVGSKGLSGRLVRVATVVLIAGLVAQVLGFGFLGISGAQQSMYFDLDYINSTRVAMGDHGTGAFFENPESALWGGGPVATIRAAFSAVFFFFVSLDLRNLDSARQLMALPEVLLFLAMLPLLWKGLWFSFKRLRDRALPLIVFSAGLLVVYGSATTNMGAMFRWRMQALPMLLAFICVGLALRQRHWLRRIMTALERAFLPSRRVRRRPAAAAQLTGSRRIPS